MRKFVIPPNNTQFTIKRSTTVVETKLDGGLARRRRDILDSSRTLAVEWILKREDYMYLCAFYDSEICQGADSFLMDLVVDTPLPVERQCWFIADTLELVEQKGLMYRCRAQLEVAPILVNDPVNTLYLDEYESDPETAWENWLNRYGVSPNGVATNKPVVGAPTVSQS